MIPSLNLCLILALVSQQPDRSTKSPRRGFPIAGGAIVRSQQPDKPRTPQPLPDMPAFKQPGADVFLFNRNIWIDKNPKGRRVLVRATVCRQEAILEEFMCLKNTKEHEAILAADIVPR